MRGEVRSFIAIFPLGSAIHNQGQKQLTHLSKTGAPTNNFIHSLFHCI